MGRESYWGDLPETSAPAVFDGADVEDSMEDVSDRLVYIPAHPGVDNGQSTVRFELRSLNDGQPAVLAFTTTERLVRQLGEAQPWLAMRMDRIQVLARMMGVETVCVDPDVTPESGRWTEADLQSLVE